MPVHIAELLDTALGTISGEKPYFAASPDGDVTALGDLHALESVVSRKDDGAVSDSSSWAACAELGRIPAVLIWSECC
jgi:hypothetical protein